MRGTTPNGPRHSNISHIDEKEFHDRHEIQWCRRSSCGKITLDEYMGPHGVLSATVFHSRWPSASTCFPCRASRFPKFWSSAASAQRDSGKYFMGTINNESRELNDSVGLKNLGCGRYFRCL